MNKLINKDCYEVIDSLDNESIDHVILDPPYGVLGNHKIETKLDMNLLFKGLHRILKKDSFLFIFIPFQRLISWGNELENNGFKFKQDIVWNKIMHGNINLKILRTHEMMYVFTKGHPTYNITKQDVFDSYVEKAFINENFTGFKHRYNEILSLAQKYINGESYKGKPYTINTPKLFTNSKAIKTKNRNIYRVEPNRHLTTIWTFKKLNHGTNKAKDFPNHPTIKPIALYERAIKLISKEGDLIFDPFLGSGTIAIACTNTKRNLIGTEIDATLYNEMNKYVNGDLFNKEVQP